jgi:DNA polymerase II large subunit
VLSHKYFADLSPDFKLDIESIFNPNKPSKQVVNVDEEESYPLGKREAPCIIDLEQEPGKR